MNTDTEFTDNQKVQILLSQMNERNQAWHKMRERSMQFTLWILGLAVAASWRLLQSPSSVIWQKAAPKRHVKQGSYAMHTMILPPDKDPTELTAWFNDAVIDKSPDNTNGRQIRREVCLLKKFAGSRKSWNLPSGLILSVLTDEVYRPIENRDDETFYNLMQNIYNRLTISGHQVYNPCDKNEELTKGADDPSMRELEGRLAWALDRLHDVKLGLCDKNEALERWKEIFNTDFFNQFIEEDKEEGSSKLNVLVNSTKQTAPKQWAL